MPRVRKSYNAVLKDPVEDMVFQDTTGAAVYRHIYKEVGSDTELLKCEDCDLYIHLPPGRSLQPFFKHSESNECENERKKRDKEKFFEEERQKEAIALQMAFGRPITSNSRLNQLTTSDALNSNSAEIPLHSSSTPMASTTYVTDLTPRASRANLRPQDDPDGHLGLLDLERLGGGDTVSGSRAWSPEDDSYDSDGPLQGNLDGEEDSKVDIKEPDCKGQRVEWVAGSVFETYAYQQHITEEIGWKPVGYSEDSKWIKLRSKFCIRFLPPDLLNQPREREWVCTSCSSLLNSPQLRRFMSRALPDSAPKTPYIYRNFRQLKTALVLNVKKSNSMKLAIMNYKRKIGRMEKKMHDYKRMIMLLSQNKIAGVSRILSMALRNGASADAICTKLHQAISGTYRPRSGWTEKEFDIAFLIKALGGPRLLYALQKAEGYPSLTTLRERKHIPELLTSIGAPSRNEIQKNMESFLGEKGRQPPKNIKVGQVFMMDGVAIEESIRYDHSQKSLLGFCREHSSHIKKVVESIGDLQNAAEALYPSDTLAQPTSHCGKDATVLGIAPVTDEENYHVVPLVLSGSCKTEKAKEMQNWVETALEEYHTSPWGARRHGEVANLSTDGESSFRKLRNLVCLIQDLDRSSALGQVLYKLVGLNCRTGRNGIIGTCDPKHIVKRFATMLRSPVGIQVGDVSLTRDDTQQALQESMDPKAAASLLNPADKQNVPKAVNLVQSLHQTSTEKPKHPLPSTNSRIKAVGFVAKVLTFFLFPFIDVTMTLSEQIQSLSTFAHLVTALYRMHRLGFLTSALLADSQAIVKSILFNLARLQLADPDMNYYILFEGTDRLENVFSHARTQDHARNFDILQLAHKLSIGAEIDAIFQRYPDLDRGHVRRNLVKARGVDHINPKSWIGNVRVGDVDIHKEYKSGRDEANKLMVGRFGPVEGFTDFDKIFSEPETDHLRPGGKIYVGFQSSESDELEEEEDEGILTGSLLSLTGQDIDDENEFEDARDAINAQEIDSITVEAQELNPSATKNDSHYLKVNGEEFYLPVLVKEYLSADKERRQLSTVRPLRARGVKIAQSLRGTSFGIDSSGDTLDSAEGQVKAGDLGAVLIRVSSGICLSVVEVLNFHQGTSKTNLGAVNIDDLDETGSKSVSVAVQMLEIIPQKPLDATDQADFDWWWSRKYIQIQEGKDRTLQKRNFVTRVSGNDFQLLAPSICYDGNDNSPDGTEEGPVPVWSIRNSELKETFERTWEEMDPESVDVVENVKRLPNLSGTGNFKALPYLLHDGSPQFYLSQDQLPAPLTVIKLAGSTKVDCLLCQKKLALYNMRNHVGIHLLKARHKIHEAGVITVGSNPCGWCGLDSLGCETQLIASPSKVSTTTANCKYHYKEMNYAKAAEFSDRTPCTNVPIHCPICPRAPDGVRTTFWKYNLKYHLETNHIDDNGKRPPLPLELIVTSHITREEHFKIGIPAEKTDKYRDDEEIFNSDDIQAMVDEEREGRKRSVSEVSISTTYSDSRQPSPSKAQRM